MLPFACFITGYVFIAKLYPVKEIDTPSVISKSLHEACTILAHHSLNARLVTVKEDPLLPDGTVISQTPLAGQKIKPNQTVFMVVVMQPAKTTAPDLIQKTVDQIQAELAAKSIRAKMYHISSILPDNTCLAQWPEPGLALENNKMIVYISQKTNKPLLIPDVKNKPVFEVVEFLKTNNILVEVMHNAEYSQENHACNTCTILDQRPLAGSIVAHTEQKPLRMQLIAKPA
jgi:beta-lactam-binding protein with PASTA domain